MHFGAGEYIPGEFGPPVRAREFHVVYDPDRRLIREYNHRADALKPGRIWDKYYLRVPFLHPKSGARTKSEAGEVAAVHMHNVLSVQSAANQEALIREAARILHKRGTIYVSEIYTASMFPPFALRELATRFGLKVKVVVQNRGRLRQWSEQEKKTLLKIMGPQGQTLLPAMSFAYLAKLTKP